MTNAAVALVLAACLSPVVTRFAGKPVWVQALLVLLCLPVVVVILAALASALRPGVLGRLARRWGGGRRRQGSGGLP